MSVVFKRRKFLPHEIKCFHSSWIYSFYLRLLTYLYDTFINYIAIIEVAISTWNSNIPTHQLVRRVSNFQPRNSLANKWHVYGISRMHRQLDLWCSTRDKNIYVIDCWKVHINSAILGWISLHLNIHKINQVVQLDLHCIFQRCRCRLVRRMSSTRPPPVSTAHTRDTCTSEARCSRDGNSAGLCWTPWNTRCTAKPLLWEKYIMDFVQNYCNLWCKIR